MKSVRIFDRDGKDVTDEFGADGILKDQHSVRVPLMFKDSAGNVIDTHRKKSTHNGHPLCH
jgi:hypothetical protein